MSLDRLGIIVIVATFLALSFTILLSPYTVEPELVGEGIVQEMRVVDPSLGRNTYIIQIMDKEYMVGKEDYYLTDIGDNIQLWRRPDFTISSVKIIEEAV